MRYTLRDKNFYSGAIYLILLVWVGIALVFFPFRLYGDVSHYLMVMINEEGFFITHSRPASVLLEWLPLLLIKLNRPMAQVILGITLAEIIYLSTITGFFLWRKKPQLAFFMLFALLIGIRWNFFNPVSELVLAAPMVFFLPDLFQQIWKASNPWYAYLALVLLTLFLVFSHPLLMAILALQAAYSGISQHTNARWYACLMLILVSFVVRWWYMDAYEKAPLQHLSERESWEAILKKFATPEYCFDLAKAYAGVFFLFCVILLFSDVKRLLLFRVFVIGFVLSWLIIVLRQYSFLYPQTFEPFERYMFIIPLGLCLLASQVSFKINHRLIAGFILVIIFHSSTLLRYAQFVKNRYQFLDHALLNIKHTKERKVYIRKANYYPSEELPRIYGHDWILGNESLVRSAMDGPTQTCQVFIKELLDEQHLQRLKGTDFLAYYQDGEDLSKLNPVYFILPSDSWVEANSDGSQMRLSQIKPGEIVGKWDDVEAIQINHERMATVEILNNSGYLFHSGLLDEKLWITMEWVDSQGKNVPDLDVRNPLMIDLYQYLRQRILIRYPIEKGSYQVRLVLKRSSDLYQLPISEYSEVIIE